MRRLRARSGPVEHRRNFAPFAAASKTTAYVYSEELAGPTNSAWDSPRPRGRAIDGSFILDRRITIREVSRPSCSSKMTFSRAARISRRNVANTCALLDGSRRRRHLRGQAFTRRHISRHVYQSRSFSFILGAEPSGAEVSTTHIH